MPTRCACPAGTPPDARSSSTTARWPSLAIDDDDNVVMVYQYRHPVGRRLWELPAGLLDMGGEPPHVTAARELKEEAGLSAQSWRVLVDLAQCPGFQRRERACVPRRRAVRRRQARGPRRGGRPDGAVVPARRRGADGAARRDRQRHCGEPEYWPRIPRAARRRFAASRRCRLGRPADAHSRPGRTAHDDVVALASGHRHSARSSTTSCRATSTT